MPKRVISLNVNGVRTALLAVLLGSCTIASAYQIGPLENKYWQSEYSSISELVSEPVHEEITNRARACAALSLQAASAPLNCITAGPTPTGTPRGNKYDSLIRGVWWNDDPNQLLFTQPVTWTVWMKDANRIAKQGKNLRGQKQTISQRYYMQYRSHYGDLQFLHSMASADGDAAEVTRQNILDWAEFSYSVATRQIETQTLLNLVETSHFQNHFKNQSGWTVSYLFGPKYRLRDDNHFQEMALGSLLHLVQDSYSDAHTQRSLEASAKCPAGRVVQFHAYGHQISSQHSTADTRSAWKGRTFSKEQDPVNVSATLIHFAHQGVGWPVVESYLRDTVFCLDTDAQEAGPGKYAQR
ncbi:hypothetical protein [Pseudomonas fluorescens]|uniref:hypothetical protein n=1 Tax=Pseudomonas fluorescens TaxID=294 RepID=UPI001249B82A|nr:hypothetical protein [Pseudomonas fluorescens]CAG8866459.1 hypothetical protein PS861_01476 [Pseudomonas fluorescens]